MQCIANSMAITCSWLQRCMMYSCRRRGLATVHTALPLFDPHIYIYIHYIPIYIYIHCVPILTVLVAMPLTPSLILSSHINRQQYLLHPLHTLISTFQTGFLWWCYFWVTILWRWEATCKPTCKEAARLPNQRKWVSVALTWREIVCTNGTQLVHISVVH